MRLDTYQFSNAGGRSYNEDAAYRRTLPDGGVFVVADGLGGTQHGEQAAACVVAQFAEADPPPQTDAAGWLKTQLEAAQARIIALQEKTHANMKSTAVALLIQGSAASWAHVGDSRLYYFRDRELARFTEDHSVAYKKYKAGQITRAQIAQDEDQSALLRALGNPERHQADFYTAELPLSPGDAFLLCSDGVWEYLPDGEILVDLLKANTAKEWAMLLLVRVLSRIEAGNDNLSLLTVMVKEGDE